LTKIRAQHVVKRERIASMIWECDDDNDGFVMLEEVIKMYFRVRRDAQGVEPSALLDLIDFVSCDPEFTGTITTIHALSLLTQRFNKQITASQMRTMAGEGWDFAPTLTFGQFCRQMDIGRTLNFS
jgi:Ca2+-binding EF-hand superfamily protein